jgi:hypothetical protein
MEIEAYDEERDDFKLFCLEGVDDVDEISSSGLFDFLEHLALQKDITNVYQTCDSFEGFETAISNLLFMTKILGIIKSFIWFSMDRMMP